MREFSQKFKTFCLNLRATKFDPNLLASHLYSLINKTISKLFSNYGLIMSWVFLDFHLEVSTCVRFEFERIKIQT
jgi:hypothetical protein